MKAMTSEEYVRAHWDYVEVSLNRERGKFVFFTNNALYNSIFADSIAELYVRGAEFTRERLEQIREIEEERALLYAKILLEERDMAIVKRILARLESALADLREGMRT